MSREQRGQELVAGPELPALPGWAGAAPQEGPYGTPVGPSKTQQDPAGPSRTPARRQPLCACPLPAAHAIARVK